MKKLIKIVIIVILIIVISLLLADYIFKQDEQQELKNIMSNTNVIDDEKENIKENEIEDKSTEIMEFAVNIFKELETDENIVISPLSIIYALATTANGADNETLVQMEDIFNTDIDSLNKYLNSYILNLPTSEKYSVNIANSIWLNESKNITLKEEFVEKNLLYYNSEIFLEEFSATIVEKLNNWVKENTNNLIEKIITEDDIKEDTLMLIANALSFDAEWHNIYYEDSIYTKKFTNYDNTISEVEMMYNTESSYIEIQNATGFEKDYANRKYSFVALLPNEGVDINEFVGSLDGVKLMNALENSSVELVDTSIPKFSFEYDNKLKSILEKLGMINAFNSEVADFSNIATGDKKISIGDFIHKAKIEVDEKGTKAGAATVVVMMEDMSFFEEIENKSVYLNRPFFYMIVDKENNVPIFMGTYLMVE